VALHHEGTLVSLSELHIDQSHASKLAPLIQDTLRASGTKITQLKAIAVGNGPGSYTGLRIGTSTAKGLCFALGIPLISVDSLMIMACQVSAFHKNALLCPMIDARRMEVYCLVTNSDMQVLKPVEAKVIDATSFDNELARSEMLFFGNGSAKCERVIRHSNAKFISDIYPSAAFLGRMAWSKFSRNDVENLTTFEPHYLKEFMIKKAGFAV
jgi:tRNA threonylcarbamoyladenosine biosynthesis protein TsaB